MLVVTKFSFLFFCKRQTLFFVVVRTGPMVMIFIFVNHLYYVCREFLVLKVLREDMVKKGIRYYITQDNSFPSILTRIVLLLVVTLLFKSVLYLVGITFNSKRQINAIKKHSFPAFRGVHLRLNCELTVTFRSCVQRDVCP